MDFNSDYKSRLISLNLLPIMYIFFVKLLLNKQSCDNFSIHNFCSSSTRSGTFINSLTLCLTTIHPVIFTSIEYLGYGILYHPVLLILINLFTLLGRASKNLCGLTSLIILSRPFLVPITFYVPVVNVVTYLIQQFSNNFLIYMLNVCYLVA